MTERDHAQRRFETRASAAALGRRLRIIMADDDHNDHLLMTMAADTAGLDVEFIFHDDGSMLLHRLDKLVGLDALPDLILLDLRMPGLDGHRTLEALPAHPTLWQIPVVVFSTSTRRSDETQAYANGAHWFVTKPSNFDGLVEFARTLPSRANTIPYEIAAADVAIDLTYDERALFDEIEHYLETEGS